MTIDAMTTITTITNGICQTCNKTYPTDSLITTAYREGAGDRGRTATSTSSRDGKGRSTLIKLWGSLSKLQVAMGETIPTFIEGDTRTLLTWVWENIRSISSLAYLKGDSDTHSFPQEALTYMEGTIGRMKEEMGPSPSFIQWEHTDLLKMEYLWAEVRSTELLFEEWVSSTTIQPTARVKVNLVMSILNRLSSYLWWCMRYENKLRGLPERVWQGYVTPFPL